MHFETNGGNASDVSMMFRAVVISTSDINEQGISASSGRHWLPRPPYYPDVLPHRVIVLFRLIACDFVDSKPVQFVKDGSHKLLNETAKIVDSD